MGIVFAKTRKGQDEIATKAGGLSPRVRRVLIFVDGKRTVDLSQRHDQKDQSTNRLCHCKPHIFLRVDNIHQIHGVAHHDGNRKAQAK